MTSVTSAAQCQFEASPDEQRKRARNARYLGREWLWERTSLRRVANCGRASIGGAVTVERYPDGHVTGKGLQYCKSVWACPVCSAKILSVRATELQAVLDAWKARGGHVAMLTATMSHTRADTLKAVWDDVQESWTRATGGNFARDVKRWGTPMPGRGGIRPRLPMIRTIETTWGPETGWHVHVHCLMLLGPHLTQQGAQDALAAIWGGIQTRWVNQAAKRGRVALARAQEAHVVTDERSADTIAGYLAKAVLTGELSMEMTRGDLKSARGERFTPFGLLELASSGLHPEKERQIAWLWREWEVTSRGRRQMIIPPGLREHLGLEETSGDDDAVFTRADERADGTVFNRQVCDVTDKPQYANAPIQGPPELLGIMPGSVWWRVICRLRLATHLGDWAQEGRLAEHLEDLGLLVDEVRSHDLGVLEARLGAAHDAAVLVV